MDKIIGYRVINHDTGMFVNTNEQGHNFRSYDEPLPISRGDAYRRLAAYLDEHPDADENDFSVEPVYQEISPIERTAEDLAGRLHALVGDSLGLSEEQMRLQIASELTTFTSLAKRFGVSE